MKNFTSVLLLLFVTFSSFSQDTQPPSAPTNLWLLPFTNTNITVIWEASTDNVAVTEYEIYLNDVLYDTVPFDGGNSGQQYVGYDNLTEGNYCFKVRAKDAAGNTSAFSNEECKTIFLPINQTPPTEVYLSGLLNYSGTNKAIEISNITDNPIDISTYELRVSYDGSGTWDAVYTFPNNTMLNSYETYIVAHSDIAICTTPINDYNNSVTGFDGNDVIGLFKSNIFYDAIGQLGSTSTIVNEGIFMKRLFDINGIPSTTFEINEWLPETDNGICPAGFGFAEFNILLNREDIKLPTFQLYPNPTNGDIVYINTEKSTAISSVSMYDIAGKLVLKQNTPNNEINVQQLQQGVYFLKVQIGDQIITKKLIKQ